jgi:hypothetical protein
VRFQKWHSLVIAVVLLLLVAPLALAQQNNPPDISPEMAGTSMAVIFGCICVAGLVGLAINIAILVWVYKDAQARGAEPMLWLILVFFTGLIGLIIWLIVRPPLRA